MIHLKDMQMVELNYWTINWSMTGSKSELKVF